MTLRSTLLVASAVVARLHTKPAFRADVAAARNEVAKLSLARRVKPYCARENTALGTQF